MRVVLTGNFVLNLYLCETMHDFRTHTHTLFLSLSPCCELTDLGPTCRGPQHYFSKRNSAVEVCACFPRPADSVSIASFLLISPFKRKDVFMQKTHFTIQKTVPIKALNSGSSHVLT